MATNPYSFSNLLKPFSSVFSGIKKPTIPSVSVAPQNPTRTIQSSVAPQSVVDAAKANIANRSVIPSSVPMSSPIVPQSVGGINTNDQKIVNPIIPQSNTIGSGDKINPNTGGMIKPDSPTTPAIPIATPPNYFSSPEYEAAIKGVESAIPLSPEEEATQQRLDTIQESLTKGLIDTRGQTIAMPFITGQSAAQQREALALAEPLETKMARLQAKRLASLDAAKFKVETEESKLGAMREYNKPVAVSAGTNLVNPMTGEVTASGGSMTDKQAQDTFYNLAQTYPDADIVWNPALNSQQNMTAAQKAASQSPSFEAKQTVYAINPLTGEPVIINKRTGGGTGGGAFSGSSGGTGGGLSIDNLAPELRSTVNSVAGVQFFDSSKATSSQLPYLQRASQEYGIPLLSKDDVNAIQTSSQAYNSAKSLMDSILELTPKVITADNDQMSMASQAAKLQAIKLAPILSTNNDAKTLLSTMDAFVSLLTRAAGEKGVLTDVDVARIRKALPSIGDSKELALQKAQQLNSVFQSQLSGAIQTYIGGVGGGSSTSSGSSGGSNYEAYLKAIGQ
jgi:hypothetical protein